ncbi:hypothetical protein [Flavobacterium ajazii]|uniref:hypothetical protein n=1 Tax=Flavobacterium ajazii TaxID=2692318 RepID=UPI0013D49FB1|nr:hypothetical protein [Flavobacterium ajazii]
MKKLSLIILFFISINITAQEPEEYKKYIDQLKKETKIDSQDKAVFDLLQEFYNQVLQSDLGELNPEVSTKFEKLYQNPKASNYHLLVMFMIYQDHITQTAAAGKMSNAKFQVDLMNDLEHEFKTVYNKVPAIVYIYKTEAFNSNNQPAEALSNINTALTAYPDSVPLKVYKYLNTKNPEIKNDLVKNHSSHWMVKQFEIK